LALWWLTRSPGFPITGIKLRLSEHLGRFPFNINFWNFRNRSKRYTNVQGTFPEYPKRIVENAKRNKNHSTENFEMWKFGRTPKRCGNTTIFRTSASKRKSLPWKDTENFGNNLADSKKHLYYENWDKLTCYIEIRLVKVIITSKSRKIKRTLAECSLTWPAAIQIHWNKR